MTVTYSTSHISCLYFHFWCRIMEIWIGRGPHHQNIWANGGPDPCILKLGSRQRSALLGISLVTILIQLLDINVTGKKLKHEIRRPTQRVLKLLHVGLITMNDLRFNSNFFTEPFFLWASHLSGYWKCLDFQASCMKLCQLKLTLPHWQVNCQQQHL
jgi:hypothetical protein